MTTAYSNLLGLALPVTGELSGTWGDTVNDYITKYLDDAIANAQVISGSQTAVTLSKTTGTALVAAGSGSTGSAQYALIRCTGNPASTLTITVSYSSLTNSQFSKTYLIFNSTSTNQSVVVQATTSSGTSTGVTITAGERALIAWNGTDFVKIATQSGTGEFVTVDTTNLEVTNIKAKDGTAAATIADSTGAITVSTLLNVDNLRLDGNTLSSTDSNGNVVLAPNGTGDVQLDADTVRVGDSAAAVTLTSNGAGALTVTTGGAADLILNTNSGTNSGSITIGNGTNGNITVATNGTGDFYVDADTVRIGDSNANATITTNGTGDLILNTNAGTNSGSITIEDGVNGNIIIAPNGTGQVQISNAALDLTTIEVTNIKAKDGTASMTLADSTGVVTFSANPVLNAGTANGVPYLSSPGKVLTTGSALSFDGTNLGVGAAWTTNPMRSTQPQYFQYGTASTANVIAADGVALFQAMRFSSNSAGAFLILSKGRGTYASPTAVASGDNIGSLDFRVYGGTNSRAVAQINGVVDTYTSDADISSYLSFAVSSSGAAASTEQMRLVAGGKLNIGGNFTSTNNTLQVTGNAAIGYTTAAPTTGLIVAGNVGIGTDAPSRKLDVALTPAAQVTGATIRSVGGTTNIGDETSIDFQVFSSTYYNGRISGYVESITGNGKGGLKFYTSSAGTSINATPSVTLDASGNLGIGTTSPSSYLSGTAKLVAYANANSQNNILLRNDSNGASSSSAIALNAAGNTWGIEIGSAAKNNNALTFQLDYGGTNSTQMTLNSSGNLGLGVTPSAWGNYKAIQVNSLGISGSNGDGGISFNGYYDGSNWKYIGTGQATLYNQYQGQHRFFTSASGSAGGTISLSQAMTLDASGNLGIGTTSAASILHVRASSATITVDDSGDGTSKISFRPSAASYAERAALSVNYGTAEMRLAAGASGGNFFQTFYTNNTERARIDAAGNLGLGVTPTANYGGLQVVGPTSASLLTQQGIDVVRMGVRGSGRTAIVLDSSDATYTNRMWYIVNEGSIGSLDIGRSGLTVLSMSNSGNLGLGVTPSAWSGFRALQVGGATSIWSSTSGAGSSFYSNNVYFDGSNRIRINAGYATEYIQDSSGGAHIWYNAASSTAGSTITFTQAMTLDASGNLLVGGTSNALSARALLENASGNQIGLRYTGVATYYNSVDSSGNLVWTKDGSERARITSGGYFKASNAGTYQDAGGTYHELRSSASDVNTVFVANTSASPYGQVIKFSSASPDNNTNWFFTCEDSTTTRLYIYSDGDLANHDGVYGTISDQKLKQDIVDAGSQWDDIKAIRFRKYRMKSDVAANPDAPALLGVIAQELEQVSPGLVDEHPDMETVEVTDEDGNVTQTQQPTGTTTKTVKSSILLMKAAVALQEAMARIEQLEAKVAALEAK